MMRETLNSENKQRVFVWDESYQQENQQTWAVEIKTQFQVEERFKGYLTWEENRLQIEEV